MTPTNHPGPNARDMTPSRLIPAPSASRQPHARGKGRPKSLTPVKALITAASVVTTMGGWALLAGQGATDAAPATVEPTTAALVIEATATAEATAPPLPYATATATAEAVQAEATASAEPVQAVAPVPQAEATATATTEPTATAEPTAPPQPTATTQTTTRAPLTRTRSSR